MEQIFEMVERKQKQSRIVGAQVDLSYFTREKLLSRAKSYPQQMTLSVEMSLDPPRLLNLRS